MVKTFCPTKSHRFPFARLQSAAQRLSEKLHRAAVCISFAAMPAGHEWLNGRTASTFATGLRHTPTDTLIFCPTCSTSSKSALRSQRELRPIGVTHWRHLAVIVGKVCDTQRAHAIETPRPPDSFPLTEGPRLCCATVLTPSFCILKYFNPNC